MLRCLKAVEIALLSSTRKSYQMTECKQELINSKREKRTRDDQDDDRSRSERRRHERGSERDLGDDDRDDRDRRHRRHRDDRDRDSRREETDEEREERRRKRRERDDRHRDRSRESHRSHPRERSERGGSGIRDMSREEKEREREKRDREMQEERQAAARQRDDRFAQVCLVFLLRSSWTDGRWTENEMVTEEGSETTDHHQGVTDPHHLQDVINEDPSLLDLPCRLPDDGHHHPTTDLLVVVEADLENPHLPLLHPRIQSSSSLTKSTGRTDRSLSLRSLPG
jgi:hypothetical protein